MSYSTPPTLTDLQMPSNSPIKPSAPSSADRVSRVLLPAITTCQHVSPTPPAHCVLIPTRKATTKISTSKVSKQRYTPAPRGEMKSRSRYVDKTSMAHYTDFLSPMSRFFSFQSAPTQSTGNAQACVTSYIVLPVGEKAELSARSSRISSATALLGGDAQPTSIGAREGAPKSKVGGAGSKGGWEGEKEGGLARTWHTPLISEEERRRKTRQRKRNLSCAGAK